MEEHSICLISMSCMTIIALTLCIWNYALKKEIEDIKSTTYEFCYNIDNQDICSYQTIGDYLNGLD